MIETVYVPLEDLDPDPRNPKRHADDTIRASIGRFGFVDPIIRDDRTGRILSGHGRADALAALRDQGDTPPEGIRVDDDGRWLVPVTTGWSSRSDEEAGAAIVALNRTVEAGGWDDSALYAILETLDDLDGVGYDTDDLDELRARLEALEDDDEDESDGIPADPPADPVAQPGDLWQVGPHRIIVGDARDVGTWVRLLDDVEAAVVFTSPPYAQQREYDPSSGFVPIPPDEYVDWWEDVQSNAARHLAGDGSMFVNIKAHAEDGQRSLYVYDLVCAHVRRWGWAFVDDLVWVRSGVPGKWSNRFKNGHEPVFHFTRGGAIKFHPTAVGHLSEDVLRYSPDNPKTHSGFLSSGGGDNGSIEGVALPSNVLQISAARADPERGHTAEFPVGLPEWFLKAYSDKRDAVVDPFLGSGTTLVAAHRTGRVGYGIELSPGYADVAIARLEQETGETARRLDA